MPVIPIKIMGLSQSAGGRGRTLFLGAVMAAGVVAFWLAIGGAIALVSGFGAILAGAAAQELVRSLGEVRRSRSGDTTPEPE